MQDRVDYLLDMRAMIRDVHQAAEAHFDAYANARRRPTDAFQIGDLVRLHLDGIKYPKFMQTGGSSGMSSRFVCICFSVFGG